jgi:hypothetical protein
MAPWKFRTKTKTFRDITDGRVIGDAKSNDARDVFIANQREWAYTLTESLASGSMTLPTWVKNMRSRLKTDYTALYALGVGGFENLTPENKKTLNKLLREQYKYLNDFAAEIATGNLSPAAIANRSTLYFESGRQAFAAGRAWAWNISLPAHPGDGGTQCRTNCKCRWRIKRVRKNVEARWELSAAENCPDCIAHSQEWNPVIFTAPEEL